MAPSPDSERSAPVSFQLEHEGFPRSIGTVTGFWGNFGVLVRAYTYLLRHGRDGIRNNSMLAVLNASYLRKQLEPEFQTEYPDDCMHEFVLNMKKTDTGEQRAMAFAKRLLDYGVHAPTVYFPLVVPEAFMIEPTESESRSTLDRFAEIMRSVALECHESPGQVAGAPWQTPVRQLDEVRAARTPVYSEPLET